MGRIGMRMINPSGQGARVHIESVLIAILHEFIHLKDSNGLTRNNLDSIKISDRCTLQVLAGITR